MRQLGKIIREFNFSVSALHGRQPRPSHGGYSPGSSMKALLESPGFFRNISVSPGKLLQI